MIRTPSRQRPHQVGPKPAANLYEQARKLRAQGFKFEAAYYLLLGRRPRR